MELVGGSRHPHTPQFCRGPEAGPPQSPTQSNRNPYPIIWLSAILSIDAPLITHGLRRAGPPSRLSWANRSARLRRTIPFEDKNPKKEEPIENSKKNKPPRPDTYNELSKFQNYKVSFFEISNLRIDNCSTFPYFKNSNVRNCQVPTFRDFQQYLSHEMIWGLSFVVYNNFGVSKVKNNWFGGSWTCPLDPKIIKMKIC